MIGSPDLSVQIGPLRLENPVMPASGCFGPELAALIPLSRLGAVVTKTVFAAERSGNPANRITDVGAGALNSVGIPSPGSARFQSSVLPAYRAHGVPVVVSVGGLREAEYLTVAEDLADADFECFEVNVSCPNLEANGVSVGTDPQKVERITRGVVARASGRPVIVKLTPNVTSITETAHAAARGGASALTVANTFIGMAIDVENRRPLLGNGIGGLSGSSIKPLVLRLVFEVSRAVGIPVVACGGIGTTRDVAQFLVAGATAVQVGTATFSQPDAMIRIIDQLPHELSRLGCSRLSDLVGSIRA